MTEHPPTAGQAFRERAQIEADRYGPDPWVFVRELIQNSRDAGARRIDIDVLDTDRDTRVSVRDDGDGMSWEAAQRYLFALYASSKEGTSGRIGRFGVGFWSVLRAQPLRIEISSRAPGDQGWSVTLAGALDRAARGPAGVSRGTRVILTLPRDPQTARRVRDAARQSARFVMMRDDPERPLPVVVDGAAINERFALPAPCVEFRRGRSRGVVALGSRPGVELFARGLRVRAAHSLDELLGATHTTHTRVRFAQLEGAIAPQILLESEDLVLMLSRDDARDDAALRRLIGTARTEFDRLLSRQLDRLRPPRVGERLARVWTAVVEAPWPARAAVGLALGLGIGLCALGLLAPTAPPRDAQPLGVGAGPDAQRRPTRPGYRELSARYAGPRVGRLEDAMADGAIDLSYVPGRNLQHFAIFYPDPRIDNVPLASEPALREDWLCVRDCLDVDVSIDARAGLLTLPMPTGHRIDTRSVTLDGQPLESRALADGRWVVMLGNDARGRLRYRTGEDTSSRAPDVEGEVLPAALETLVQELASLPIDDRARVLRDAVAILVRYDTSAETAAMLESLRASGVAFADRTLRVGAGDCDVQNGLLTLALRRSGIPARMAVGWVGREGRAVPVLHAWVEWIDDRGRWRVADASAVRGSTLAVEPAAGHSARSFGEGGAPTPEDGGEDDGSAGSAADDATDDATAPSESAPYAGARPVLPPRAASSSGSGTQPQGVGDGHPGQGEDATSPGGARAASGSEPSSASEAPDSAAGLRATLAWAWWITLIAASLGTIGVLTRRGVWPRARMQLDDRDGLAALLHGAIMHPSTFKSARSLYVRPLVPTIHGTRVSLEQARAAARAGMLLSTGSPMMRVLPPGSVVLDRRMPEGRVVADGLSALDLDRWTEAFAAGATHPLLEGVAVAARRVGLSWSIRAASGVGAVSSLPVPVARAGQRWGREIAVDPNDRELAVLLELSRVAPASAGLALGELLVEHVPETRGRGEALLEALAGPALAEIERRAAQGGGLGELGSAAVGGAAAGPPTKTHTSGSEGPR